MFYIFAEIFDISNCSHPFFFGSEKLPGKDAFAKCKDEKNNIKKRRAEENRCFAAGFCFFSIPISPLALF